MMVCKERVTYHSSIHGGLDLFCASIRCHCYNGDVAGQLALGLEFADLSGAIETVHHGHLLV